MTVNVIICARCGEKTDGMGKSPYVGELGKKILDQTCPKCWQEWIKQQVIIINDFKLVPFMPQHRATLEQHMKEFLKLA